MVFTSWTLHIKNLFCAHHKNSHWVIAYCDLDLLTPKANQHIYEPKYICDQNWVKFLSSLFNARAYARAVLGVVILSVCPSVCLSDACIVTKLNDALQMFYTTRKGNHSATLIPRVVGRQCPLPSEICVQSDPPPSKNADFDRFPLITSQP